MRKVWAGIGCALSLWSMNTQAFDRQEPSFHVGELVRIQGVVHFEKHQTLIPLNYCDPAIACPQSRPYWSLVLASDTARYELDQRFAEGESSAPSSIVIDGLSIREGEILRAQARVEYATSEYYIVGDLRDARTVMSYSTHYFETDDQTLSLPNWDCHGNVNRNTEIQVAVWYGGTAGNYLMRLFGAEEGPLGRRVFPLLSLDDAFARRDGEALVYDAESSKASVQLVIGRSAPERDAQATLKFMLEQIPVDSRIPAQTQLGVSCNRIR